MNQAPTYNPGDYNKYRPTYPKILYEKIYAYHKGKWEIALDVGTGTGQNAFALAESFEKVDATDTSQKMLDQAESCNQFTNVAFKMCDAELIHNLGKRYDLIAASEAAHWFDMEKFYDCCRISLSTNGTLAIWGYALFQLEEFELANQLIWDYSNITIGSFWDERRKRLDGLYKDSDFIDGKSQFADWERTLYDGKDNPFIMTFDWSLHEIGMYLKTWSPYKKWNELCAGKEPDIVDLFIDQLMDFLRKSYNLPNLTMNYKLKVNFPLVLILARKNE